MNKLFRRIVLGLAAIIFALGLFSMLVFKLMNTVREEQHWHDFLVPFFEPLVESVFSLDLPNGLSYVPYDRDQLSYVEHRRLKAGQLVVDLSHTQIKAQKYVSQIDRHLQDSSVAESESIILLESERGGEQLYEFIAWSLKQNLQRFIALDRPQAEVFQSALDAYAVSLNVAISKLESSADISMPYMLESLADKGWAKISTDDNLLLYLRLPTAEIYLVVLPAVFNPLSLPVVLFLMVCAVISIALLANQFVQSFDRRIRTIESAASRISRGELDARVATEGEGDAISRLGSSFNSMADHIQRLMYVQKEMIHAVSHELRTPVARIRFGVQMIEDCQTPASVQKQVKGIDGDIQELDELIDEILTYARLEQGGPILAFQQADVASIVEQVIAEQSSDKPGIKIFADYKEGSDSWKQSEIEARYIHRSIQNLVGNARRYAESKVKVSCAFDADTCRIDVEDDGPGIPEAQWESVFTPFARLDDSRTRSSGGYGLGLSIVRRILYWHGGQAFLGRSDMGGAKFSLVWPRKQTN